MTLASAPSAARPLYPLFLKVEGMRAVVVGGGAVGCHKAVELAAAGARVVVISPRFAAEVPAALERVERPFAAGDTRGARLVIAATGDRAVDDAVAAEARENGALVNVVDRSEVCDFYSGAVVRRGPLQILIGTSGASPALARKVRQRLEQLLPPSLGVLADVLGRARPRLLAALPSFSARAEALDRFVERAWDRFVRADDPTAPHDDDALRAAIEAALAREVLNAPGGDAGEGSR
jgi:siroheme synthase-like protein